MWRKGRFPSCPCLSSGGFFAILFLRCVGAEVSADVRSEEGEILGVPWGLRTCLPSICGERWKSFVSPRDDLLQDAPSVGGMERRTEPEVAPSKACLPLTVMLVPLGALSLTSRVAVEGRLVSLLIRFQVVCPSENPPTLAQVVEVLVDELLEENPKKERVSPC
jgi:hypothetical protein